MKKIFYVAATAAMLASCSTDFDLSEVFGSGGTSETIGFQVQKGNNVTRATSLQDARHYNFGVFGYKSTDKTHAVMSDYLVGYFDQARGYYDKAGTTVGDKPGVEDGTSYWMYEGLGKDEFFGTYADTTLTRPYQSNNSKQYLKYWDKSAEYTCFYAYAPYVGTDEVGKVVTYVDGVDQQATGNDEYVMHIPDGSLVAGHDDPSKYEYMYAAKKVLAADYGHDVSLDFKRLVAKVNIKFWDDVAGYKVRILDLKQGQYEGVQATPAIQKSSDTPADPKPSDSGEYGPYNYRYGTYYQSNGVKIQFNSSDLSANVKQYKGTVFNNGNKQNLIFAAPEAQEIGETRAFATPSPTNYYAIPKGSTENVLSSNDDFTATGTAPSTELAKTGFTFHVSYELKSDDTGERIIVQDATVHVPCDYCKWEANTHYTYIFKITKNSNGSTDTDPVIDPENPDVPTDQALYPIVFDNCTVQDWAEDESDWTITDGTNLSYHNISLTVPQNSETEATATKPCYSIAPGTATKLTVKIADADKHNNHAVDYSAKHNETTTGGESKSVGVEVTGPSTTTNWYKYNAGNDYATIEVPADAQEGVYTVTYYCPDSDIDRNHPQTWTAKFYVGQKYTITTSHDYVGTKFTNSSPISLAITGTRTGTASEATYNPEHNGLSIEYPAGLTPEQKNYVKIDDATSNPENKVVVTNQAVPGEYKVVYKKDIEGTKVKVAEHVFYVKDYNFTFSPTTVYNKVGGTKITCSQWNSEIADKAYTTTLSGPTFTNNAVTIPNNTTENTYTITYTIWNGGSDAAEATYTKSFTVENTYSVTLNKATLNRDTNRGESDTYGTDYLVVTTLKNGEADEANRSNIFTVLNSNGEDKTSSFKIDCIQTTDTPAAYTNTYKLQASKSVTEGIYTLVFTGQTATTQGTGKYYTDKLQFTVVK